MNHTARADFERIIGVLSTIESAWRGVRYIRDELLQQARVGAPSPAGATRQTGADRLNIALGLPESEHGRRSQGIDRADWSVVGIGLSGVTNSVDDNQCDLIYPAGMSEGLSDAVTNDEDLMAWIKDLIGDP